MQKINCYFLIVTPIVTSVKGLIVSLLQESNIFNVFITFHMKMLTPETSEIQKNFNLDGLQTVSTKDFENVKQSYIFVNTPYFDSFLKDLNIKKLLSCNKFLNVNYAYHIHKQLYDIIYNHNEFKRFYASFHECSENYDDFIKYIKTIDPNFNFKSAHLSGSTKIEYLKMIQPNSKKMFVNNNTTILFSFRWEKVTKNYTGTEFVPFFIEYIKSEKNINFIYRPHPLSSEKVLENVKQPNFLVDFTNDYKQTFDNSNIFISDLSTLISDFFIYRKCPIILLNTNNKLEDILNSFGCKIIVGIYVVKNVSQLKNVLNSLLLGNDPKKEIRQQIASELDAFSPNQYIKNFLKNDSSK